MTVAQYIQAAKDTWRPNRYVLKEYVLRDGKRHPFALICPGGGYRRVCSFVEGKPYAKALNAKGYSAFVLYYRCKDKARLPAPQDDVARALKDILARANALSLDTEGYSLWGSSAGGHLAASFCTNALGFARYGLPAPAALILSYPVVSMGELAHAGSRNNLLGATPSPELIRKTSVEQQIGPDYPPTFLWCGTADQTVSPDNSRVLARALEANGIPHLFREYLGVDHGIGLGKGLDCEGWFEEAVEFWERQRKHEMA